MSKRGAVAILSGGIDSATALAMALEQGYSITHAIWFDYGQRHAVERVYAERLAAHYDLSFTTIQVPQVVFGENQLTYNHLTPRLDTPMREITKGVAPTFVPGRNMVMLALAASYAVAEQMDAVVGGWHWDDSSGYPDCRASFIQAMQGSINEAMGMVHFAIEAPLISLSKNQIISNAVRLGVPIDRTWSCYSPVGNLDPIAVYYHSPSLPIGVASCGRCDTCQLRIKGFKDAGFIDPIPYAIAIDWTGCESIGGTTHQDPFDVSGSDTQSWTPKSGNLGGFGG